MAASDYLIVVIAYFLGSIPFGLLLTKYAGLGDIRKIGSGNIGATNVMRTGNKLLGILTLLLDGLKGYGAVMLASYFASDLAILFSAFFVVIGHMFPIWLNGRGGKGVATTLAVLIAICWPLALFTIATWIIVFALTRISSLSAILAILLTPVYAYFLTVISVCILTIFLSIIVIAKHHENIKRMLGGKELKFRK